MRTSFKMGRLQFALLQAISIFCILNVSLCSESKSDGSNVRPFIPTKDWQIIAEGQAVPRGLHVRINLQTGVKEAKLLDGDEETENVGWNIPQTDEQLSAVSDPSALLEIPTESADKNIKAEIKFDHSELKLALKKIKNDGKESNKDYTVKRTYEQMKKEMEEIQHSIKSEYEIVKDLIAEYRNTKEDTIKADVLLDLEYYVHQYDNALDFTKMDGFKTVVLPSLNSTDATLRSAAAFLMGSCCQSNPQVQISALEVGALPILIRLITFDTSMQVRSRALYALSSIIRHFPAAQKVFFDEGGISAFSRLFLTDSNDLQKLQLKIITLLSDIITEKNTLLESSTEDALERKNFAMKLSQYDSIAAEKVLVEQGFCNLIPRLLTQLKTSDDNHDVVEKVVQAMLPLSQHCHQDFLPVRSIISQLKNRYMNLSAEETRLGNEESSEHYFTKLYDMCQQLYSSLQREEL